MSEEYFEDKELALAKFLDVDPSTIENGYSHYYTVNERTEKHGKTPEEHQRTIDGFRSLLSSQLKRRITWALKGSKKARKNLYEDIKEHLETQTDSETYKQLAKENLYVENVPYNLLEGNGYHVEYYLDMRKAWLRQPLEDHREDRNVSDGEYLVLTDSEADEWEREGLESLFEDMTSGVEEFYKNYLDTDRFVDDHSGNRGENISGYNGIEDEVDFDGTTYYIYRNN